MTDGFLSGFLFRLQVPSIVKALHKQLKEKSIKSRQGCFSVLTELANVLPGCLADHIPALVPGKLVHGQCHCHPCLHLTNHTSSQPRMAF